MVFVPLNDSTEARYGEIAREMLVTGNWVTLFHNYGIPFWAKPPLSTWLSALSMKLLGVNEFAARLPALLLSIATLWLVWDLAKNRSGPTIATIAVLVLASCAGFFLNAGTVMTDPALLFCTTLTLASFWHVFTDNKGIWRYLFFVSLGLGLLAKGPIALVLTGLPIMIWLCLRKQWRTFWLRFPWLRGTGLLLAIALPWYILAETYTPGFLKYFIVGEHFSRFLEAGWSGNKYGFAHTNPFGMIWVYALVGILPWTPTIFFELIRAKKILRSAYKGDDGWVLFLLLAAISPLVFFTFAKNIIYPYIFPCLPPFALLYADFWSRNHSSINEKRLFLLPILVSICFLVVSIGFIIQPNSQKNVITAWKNQQPASESNLLYWTDNIEYSGQFYSQGRAKATVNISELRQLLSSKKENFFIIQSSFINQIPSELLGNFKKIATIKLSSTKKMYLFKNIL